MAKEKKRIGGATLAGCSDGGGTASFGTALLMETAAAGREIDRRYVLGLFPLVRILSSRGLATILPSPSLTPSPVIFFGTPAAIGRTLPHLTSGCSLCLCSFASSREADASGRIARCLLLPALPFRNDAARTWLELWGHIWGDFVFLLAIFGLVCLDDWAVFG